MTSTPVPGMPLFQVTIQVADHVVSHPIRMSLRLLEFSRSGYPVLVTVVA